SSSFCPQERISQQTPHPAYRREHGLLPSPALLLDVCVEGVLRGPGQRRIGPKAHCSPQSLLGELHPRILSREDQGRARSGARGSGELVPGYLSGSKAREFLCPIWNRS